MPPELPPRFDKRPDNLFTRTARNVSLFWHVITHTRFIHFLGCTGIIVLFLWLVATPTLIRFENIFLDFYFRRRPMPAVHPSIIYIEIAEDSLQALGRWPWPRHYHAKLTHILNQWNAKAIVFDMIFSEASTPFDDGAFAEALKERDAVYFPVVLEPKGDQKIWLKPVAPMNQFVHGMGHINIIPDEDGVLRRTLPYVSYGREFFPHLAMKVAYDALHQEVPPPEKIPFPLDQDGKLLINWTGNWAKTYKHFSYVEIIGSFEAIQRGEKPLIDPEEFRDKICLIGLTATGHADIKANPMEAVFPALGIHSNIINSILTNQFVRPAPLWVNMICLVLMGLIAAASLVGFQNVRSFITSLILGIVWMVLAFLCFWLRGVWLYVFHPFLLVLSLFIFSALYSLLVTRREQNRLFDLATRDGLTGLYVIRHFREVLNQAVQDAQRKKDQLSVILLDIDDFKPVNDTYGHPAGDMVLKKTAQIIHDCLRSKRPIQEVDFVARYGGEEFIIMMRSTKLENAAFRIAERIRRSVEEAKFKWDNATIRITVSLGVSTLHVGENVPDPMVRRADEALYRAKAAGKNKIMVENPTLS